MTDKTSSNNDKFVIERKNIQSLLDALAEKGFQIIGPLIIDHAVDYGPITSIEDLPIGWIEHQNGGFYRLVEDDKKTLFAYVVGPFSWKKFLYPFSKKLTEAKRVEGGFEIIEPDTESGKLAFFGVRSCELQAISILDRVLADGPYSDPGYVRARKNLLIVAVNCTRAGDTCFCVSMRSGPKVHSGFDLALTEVTEGDLHYFLAEVGTETGADLLSRVPRRNAEDLEMQAAERAVKQTEKNMGRTLDTNGIKELLNGNLNHPHWEEVALRCLTCGNCTMVCPTCFCSTISDFTDLRGKEAWRWRTLDSCFSIDFSYIHGGSVRSTPMSRYRQWMTHKLAGWIDQFGTSGCVGCGRCITWCPVGIDITEEANAFRGD